MAPCRAWPGLLLVCGPAWCQRTAKPGEQHGSRCRSRGPQGRGRCPTASPFPVWRWPGRRPDEARGAGSCLFSSLPDELLLTACEALELPGLTGRLGMLCSPVSVGQLGGEEEDCGGGAEWGLQPALPPQLPCRHAAGASTAGRSRPGSLQPRWTTDCPPQPSRHAAARASPSTAEPYLECPTLYGSHREAVGSPALVMGRSSKCRNLTECWILRQDLLITLSFKKKLKLPSQCLQMEKFGAAVDSLSRNWSDQNPELGYERAFLTVSVKLITSAVKKVPAVVLCNQLIQVINGNSQVRNYIEALGGWVRM